MSHQKSQFPWAPAAAQLVFGLLFAVGVNSSVYSQQTDPLGNPIPPKTEQTTESTAKPELKTPVNPPTAKPETPKPETPKTETQKREAPQKDQAKQGTVAELPSLPASMTSQPNAAENLRNYQPPDFQRNDLPKTRDFNREGQTVAERRTQVEVTEHRVSELNPQQEAQAPAEPAIAVQSAEGTSTPAPHAQFELIKRSTERWEFGLEIVASGNIAGAVASAPVPIEWDEQKIKIIQSFKSPNVASVKIKKFPDQGQQMIVSVPRLAAGETARATVTMELERFDIIKPTDTNTLQLPKKGNRSAKLYLGESPYIETRHKRIRELADTIVKPEDTPWDQALSIYDWVQQNIQYQFDPQIHSCIEALDEKRGDCEEVASLFIALCRVKGIPARAVWCNDHTYPEFMLCTPDGKDVWFPCQITTTEHMFGVMFDDRPILQKGDKFSILGEAAPFRYLKPALTVKNAAGPPTFRWIIQKLEPGTQASPENSPLGN